MELSLTNVINISISQGNPGIGPFNTSNLAYYTDELPASPVETIGFSAVAASGTFVLNFGSLPTAAINWNDSAATIQGKVQAVSGLTHVLVTGSIASESLVLTQPGQYGAIPLATVSANSVQDAGSNAIVITPVTTNPGWSGGALGYAIYNSPTQVGVDFGTGSKTFAMANGTFSQTPNILAGGGQLVIFLLTVATQTFTLSALAASGTFVFNYGGHASAAINWNDNIATIQGKIQAIPGLSEVLVTGSIASELLTVQYAGVYGNIALATISANSLQTGGSVAITFVIATSVTGQTWANAINATQGVVQYFGVMVTDTLASIGQTDMLAAAAVIQPLNLMGFVVSTSTADITPGGALDLLRTGSLYRMRGLYYGNANGFAAITEMASYAGRAMSVNFNGSLTTITMNLKTLNGVQPDPSMTQTIYNQAQAAGVDIYVSYEGDPAVACFGANQFFDQVYNLSWFIGALQTNGFNTLAQTPTKIPQTENGMNTLKASYRQVCQQGIVNQYLAPGTWSLPTTFGTQASFLTNISQVGYYIYSAPITQQLQAQRALRQAPLVQIAIKQAGAIQSSSVLININA